MKNQYLNYRIIIARDYETGTNKLGYTAFCPTLGVADDGDTVEEAIKNVQGAIEAYVESLIEDGLEVPIDSDADIVMMTQIKTPSLAKAA